RAHWGVIVTTLDGTTVYALDEGKLFRPASTAKLFTTAAAMDLLGPEHHFLTRVYGDVKDGAELVEGDLVLVGGGDPSFGTRDLPYRRETSTGTGNRDLQSLVDQLRAKGIRHIRGNVSADDSLFRNEEAPQGWAAEDLLWSYGALPSALSFADNELALTVTAQGAELDQITPLLSIKDLVSTDPQISSTRSRISIQPVAGQPLQLLVQGHMGSASPAVVEHIAIPEPARYAASALRASLLASGIQVDGAVEVVSAPPVVEQPFLEGLHSPGACDGAMAQGESCAGSCAPVAHPGQIVAEHTSPPLQEEVAFTLKTSANLHAEVLLHQLALALNCSGVSTLDGARTLRSWLLRRGIADGDFLFYDGSGLSTKDLVTPRAEVQLLAYAVTQPWFALWKAALPVGGVDGTLSSRFTQPPLKGRVFAKTGTLGESRALAGYVVCASGRELIFSILVDDHLPGSSADRTAMDGIVAAIAALN
ncbi:MAG TPA: D-alanyl-D-alanine carboxypeptidase/D-alanyl-D-alanine-endopeptidase, partial [Acidobacteriaceae bacterium]|nr:D-alanyl-D-alanine carboxypeptidase/D-alanyl-D-alanine-endopeptidase [Acidobacteriaceae bacterium]